jgi:hypothetical protein
MSLNVRDLQAREQAWQQGNYSGMTPLNTTMNQPPSGRPVYNPATGQYTSTTRATRTDKKYIGCDPKTKRRIYRYTELIDTTTTTYTPVGYTADGRIIYQSSAQTTTATGRTWTGY